MSAEPRTTAKTVYSGQLNIFCMETHTDILNTIFIEWKETDFGKMQKNLALVFNDNILK